MRCPKCSYISFDITEACVKCGKNISDAASSLAGTVAGKSAPSFLKIPRKDAPSEAPEETEQDWTEEPFDLEAAGEGETEISLDDEPSAEAEEFALDIGGDDEAEVELDLGEDEAGVEETAEIDLGGGEVAEEYESEEAAAIGISDLAPSEEGEKESPEELFAEEAEALGTGGSGGLESLEVEGIDLQTPVDTVDSGKIMPSVKTGTALDDFDIDLGDLLTRKDED